jgi:hypothetical protein
MENSSSKLNQLAALPKRAIFSEAPMATAIVAAPLVDENQLPGKKGRGRPKIVGVRPWEAEGICRALWYRRKKENQL